MKKVLKNLAFVAATVLMFSACSEKKTNEVNNFRIQRGTNVSHWLSQSEERGEARLLHIQEDDFARLDSLGFDFVRLPIDEVQFWDEQGNKLPEAWDLMLNAINWAEKHHLRTIVDLHIIRSHYFNAVNEGQADANTLFTSEKAQQDLINMWYQLSDVLKGYSNDSVAYEFMNEPVAEDHEQWNQLIAKVHKALREREPQRTLVIGSNMWQSYETIKYLKVPENDKNMPMTPLRRLLMRTSLPLWSGTLIRFVPISRMLSRLPRSIIYSCSVASGVSTNPSTVNWLTSGRRIC